MPALSKSSLLQLVGFDSNVVVSDILFGETFSTDVIFMSASGRTVSSIAGAVITFINGDNTVFSIGQFVSFVNDTNSYSIVTVGTNTLTLNAAPSTKVNGDPINLSLVLNAGTTFTLRVTEYTTTGVTESKGSLDLGTVTIKMPSTLLTLDSSVAVVDLTKGWVRINLAANTFTDVPTPADAPSGAVPIIYAGSLGLNQPAGASPTLNPATIQKQRLVWLIWSDLA